MSTRHDNSQKWKAFETQFTAFREDFRKSPLFDTSIALRRLYSLSFVCETTRLLLKLGPMTMGRFVTEVRWIDDYFRAVQECHEQSGQRQLQVPEANRLGWEALHGSWDALFRAMWGAPSIKLASSSDDPGKGRIWHRVPLGNRRMKELTEDMLLCYPIPDPVSGEHASQLSSDPTFKRSLTLKTLSTVNDGSILDYPPPTYEQATQGEASSLNPKICTDGAFSFTHHSR